MGISQKTVSTEEVDDYLLGPLEDVAMFCEMGAISWEQACSEFRSFLDYCCQNKDMQEYLRWVQTERPKHWYRFKKFCDKCKKIAQSQ